MLKDNLPGTSAQLGMSPKPLHSKAQQFNPVMHERNPRESAVMLCLTGDSFHTLEFILTLRNPDLPLHGGQLSFPGGGVDSNEKPMDAAIRETYEEIGIIVEKKDIIGSLTPFYVAHSNNLVHTFVSCISEKKEFRLQQDEVSEAFYVALSDLFNPDILTTEVWDLRGTEMMVPYWNVHDTPLWGATAMILNEFVVLLSSSSGALSRP